VLVLLLFAAILVESSLSAANVAMRAFDMMNTEDNTLFCYCSDSASISPEITAEWLQLLQQQLQDHGLKLSSSSSSSMRTGAGKQQEFDLQPFIR
jgi:hypothetical protein